MDDLYRQIFKHINQRNSTFPTVFYTDGYFLIDKKEWNQLQRFNAIESDSDIVYLYKINDLRAIAHASFGTFNETKKKYNVCNFRRYLNHVHKGTKTCKYLDAKTVVDVERLVKGLKRVDNCHVNTVMVFFNYFKFNIPLFNALLLNVMLYDRGLVATCILKLPKKKKMLFEQILKYNTLSSMKEKERRRKRREEEEEEEEDAAAAVAGQQRSV
uniref:Membrane protein n=1 Tax=Panulirus argus virus 1 TaxID=380624 RepID=A0A6G9HDQ6_9VIRU|nr:membrane protein [Panulirus argus virus 1]